MLLLGIAVAGCARDTGSSSGGRSRAGKLVVAASIHPLASLVREIAGPDATVLELLPPGASPHSFEPSPRLVAAGTRASMVVRVGAGLDDWARPIVAEVLDRGAPEIVAASYLDSLLPAVPEEDVDEPAHGHAEGPSDPHVWLDPPAMIPVCEAIGQALAKTDPPHAAEYASRTAACAESLRALDRQLDAIFAPARGASFVATHNAWSYLCRRYHLTELDVLQRIPTREPGPRRMAELIREASRAGARAVFTEVQVSNASAVTLAGEVGLRIALLDPQGTPLDPARDRYFDLLRWNARRMVEALAPAGAPAQGGS